jgi:DNA-binding response OmpR family regulator
VHLLVVEDNPELSAELSRHLQWAGHSVTLAGIAADALARLRNADFDAIILDLGLPDEDGLSVLRDPGFRRRQIPALILTARAEIKDRVAGLQAGADDYLAKPFAVEELLARLEVISRRNNPEQPSALQLANVSFDVEHRHVAVAEATLILSARELDILEVLMRRKNKVVAKRVLEDVLFAMSGEGGANAIEVYVHRLRKRLLDSGARVEIHTVRGVGYCLKERL